MLSFLDTNVLVYLFDDSAPKKKAKAQEILKSADSEGSALLSTQVLQEFYVSVTKKLAVPLPAEVAERAVIDLAALPLVQVDLPMILAAVRLNQDMNLSFWDALIVAAALAGGAERLFSEDLQDGQEIDGLRIENPFS